ncbi:hypothetical protein [Lacisediminimonas profundi]|uniref:hypothetical protein n=1 Tax=Lacisediminimonas profundi TaxID=2603856 RepID=UPI00124B7FE6|nr:hypothetical protein [Lacisediminimonas profundi]
MGSSGSQSSANQSQTTYNTDKRITLQSGVALSSENSTVNVETLDGAIVQRALDVVSNADATNGDSFSQLLSLADKIITGAGQLAISTQDSALKAYSQATTEKAGTIDNKTMIILGVAAAAALVMRGK